MVAAVAVVGLVAALAVVFAGPVQVGPPRWQPRPLSFTHPPQDASASPLPLPRASGNAETARVVGLILEILLAALAAALVVVLVRWLVRRFRQRRRLTRRPGGPEDAATLSAAVVETAISVPVIQRGIQRALQILAERRHAPRDAVVAAWLGLEETAMLAGARRGAAETPTEYTARIIGRFDTDREAADALVRLYQDVRFGSHPIDEDAVMAARSYLIRLQESWHEDSAAAAHTAGPGRPA